MPLSRGLGQGILPTPRLDQHGFRQVGMQHLIPTHHDLPVFTHDLLQALIEIGLQIAVVLHAVSPNEFLDFRIRVPRLVGHFIAANVKVSVGEEARHFPNKLVEELIGPVPRGIHDGIGVRDPARPVRAGHTGKFRITGHPGAAVSGHVEFWNHADPAVARIGHEVADLGLRVVLSLRAQLLQLGKALALDAETLIVGKMPVQDIHLHRRHSVEVPLQYFDGDEMAADVNQQATPGKARLILNGDHRHGKPRRSRVD